jgi:hypothetical protein
VATKSKPDNLVPTIALLCLLFPGQSAIAALEITLHRGGLAESGLGDARLRGQEHGLALDWAPGGSGWQPVGVGVAYAYTRYEYDNLPTRNRDLHRAAMPIHWSWRGDTAHALELRPVIATSSNVMKDLFSRGTSDDLMMQGRWRIERTPAATGAGWAAGIARDDAFGGQRFYPEITALWRRPGYEVGLGWPRTWVHHQASAAWRLVAGVAPSGARWHVVSDERDGAEFDYEVEAWRAQVSAEWRSAHGFLLQGRTGFEFRRRHRFEDDEGNRVDRRLDDAAHFELRIAYRW